MFISNSSHFLLAKLEIGVLIVAYKSYVHFRCANAIKSQQYTIIDSRTGFDWLAMVETMAHGKYSKQVISLPGIQKLAIRNDEKLRICVYDTIYCRL